MALGDVTSPTWVLVPSRPRDNFKKSHMSQIFDTLLLLNSPIFLLLLRLPITNVRRARIISEHSQTCSSHSRGFLNPISHLLTRPQCHLVLFTSPSLLSVPVPTLKILISLHSSVDISTRFSARISTTLQNECRFCRTYFCFGRVCVPWRCCFVSNTAK